MGGNAVARVMSAMDDRGALATLLHSVGRSSKKRASAVTNASFLQASSFATHNDKKLSLKVKVYPSAPLDMAVEGYIDAVGRERGQLEQAFFDQARAEIGTLIEFIAHEVVTKIDTQLDTFLQ